MFMIFDLIFATTMIACMTALGLLWAAVNTILLAGFLIFIAPKLVYDRLLRRLARRAGNGG